MIPTLKCGYQTRERHIRFTNIDEFESYIYAIDQSYESEDAIFNG